MFKPLLRTIPTLTGNISLNCELDNLVKESSYEWAANVVHASAMPLQNNLINNVRHVSLMRDLWEQNVKTFYGKYKNVFYNDNYIYNKKDYQDLDITASTQLQPRNTDYEFGCKRIPYGKTGFTYNFFAPFYCDNVEDLPDYFIINLKINEHIKKVIKININKEKSDNYLRIYLNRFFSKISDNVVYLQQESNQATYFGIDALYGELVQVKDNVIGQIFNKQNTINNVDNLINEGFMRNHMIMSQIMPLSFSFNLSDILSEVEMRDFAYSDKISVTGWYEKNTIQYDFYDFETNYLHFHPIISEYNEKINDLEYHESDTNVMNVLYPSLNEGYFDKYKRSNKLTHRYNHWKLKYSSDDAPYITNFSFAFSYCSNSNYNYGEFPIIENAFKPLVEIDEDNLKYDISSTRYKVFRNNHMTSWYDIVDSENTINECITYDNGFSEVKDNRTYYKGILYDLSSLYNTYSDIKNIDKFAVFVKPSVLNVNSNELCFAENLIDDATSLQGNATYTSATEGNIFIDSNIYNCKISNDELFVLNKEGKGNYVELQNDEDFNNFYSVKELEYLYPNETNAVMYYNTSGSDILNSEVNANTFDDSYKILNIYNTNNIFSETNKGLSIFNIYKDTFANYNNHLYISSNVTTSKIDFSETLLRSPKFNQQYNFFEKDSFISSSVFEKIANEKGFNIDFNLLTKYEYVPYKSTDIIRDNTEISIINNKYFKEKNINNIHTVYVLNHNIEEILSTYNIDSDKKITIDDLTKTKKFAKLSNLKDLNIWHKTICKDNSYLDKLYIKERNLIYNASGISVVDNFIPLKEYLTTYGKNDISYYENNFGHFYLSLTESKYYNAFVLHNFIDDDSIQEVKRKNIIEIYFADDFYIVDDTFANIIKKSDYNIQLYMHDTDQYNDYILYDVKEHIGSTDNIKNVHDSLISLSSTLDIYDNEYKDKIKYWINNNIIYKVGNHYEYNKYDVHTMINKNIYDDIYGTLPPNVTTYDKISSIKTNLVNTDKSYNGLNIVSHNGKNYGYYCIDEKFINAIYAFNVNYNRFSSKIFTKINNENISDRLIYTKFNELGCFLNTPLFTYIINNTPLKNIIVQPSKFNIDLYYRQFIKDTGNSNESYKYNMLFDNNDTNKNVYNIEFFNTDKPVKININRYTNMIVPFIPKATSIKDLHFLRYKTVGQSLNEDNMYYLSNVSIYQQPKIEVITKTGNKELKDLYERKYYNDSTIYLCLPKINVTLKNTYTYKEIIKLETFENTYNEFRKYILNNKYFYDIDEKLILFLFNKYNVNYIVDPINSLVDNKLYKLTYKFTLI